MMRRLKYCVAAIALLLFSVMPFAEATADTAPYVSRMITQGPRFDNTTTLVASQGRRIVSTVGNFGVLYYFDGQDDHLITPSTAPAGYNAAIDGNYIAYTETDTVCSPSGNGAQTCGPGPSMVKLYNTDTFATTQITDSAAVNRSQPAIKGNYVAWLQQPANETPHDLFNQDVWLYNAQTATQTQLTFDINQYFSNWQPVFAGNSLFWISIQRSTFNNVVIASTLNQYDLTTGVTTQTQIATGSYQLTGEGNAVAWTDSSNVYVYDGTNISTIYSGFNVQSLELRGNLLVWISEETPNGDYSYKYYDLAGAALHAFPDSPHTHAIATDGQRIAYLNEEADGSQQPAILDTATNETTYVANDHGRINFIVNGATGYGFAVANNFIAWSGSYTNAAQGTAGQYMNLYVAEPEYKLPAPGDFQGFTNTSTHKAVLAWNAVPLAVKYNVYIDGQLAGHTTATSFAYTAQEEGNSHVYTVSATNSYGTEGLMSGPANLTEDDTGPTLSDLSWTSTLFSPSQSTTASASASDDGSGMSGGVYMLSGTSDMFDATQIDPNQVDPLWSWSGANFTHTFGPNLPPGVYQLSAWAKDAVGNWSTPSTDYFVVTDNSGNRVAGGHSIVPSLANGDVLPGLIHDNQKKKATFGMVVKYNKNNKITSASHFMFNYQTGSNCGDPVLAKNCHTTSLNSTAIQWLTTDTSISAENTDTFQGTGTLMVDGTQSQVVFKVRATDNMYYNAPDQFELFIYPAGSNTAVATPLYSIHLASIAKGDIKVTPQTPPGPPA